MVRPLQGRELWRIGDWGGASGQIGRHWEEIGASALGRLVGRRSPNHERFLPLAAASLVNDRQRELAVQAAGLTHADALLVGSLDGRVALQPVDFKWSLEVARPAQVAAEALQALLEAELEVIREALELALSTDLASAAGLPAGLPPLHELRLLDGLFLAPDHADNRAFLDSQANRHQETPLDSRQVVLEAVDGPAFFSPLPGWSIGELLAGQEGARRMLGTVEGAEHYYRLGAGVLGAIVASKRSIFAAEPPSLDPLGELARLRRFHRLTTTVQLIGHLERLMRARSELVKSFNQLGRTAYPFVAFRKALTAAGIRLPERSESGPDDRRWSRLYGQVQRDLQTHLAAEGRALVAAGQNDAQALTSLTASGPELARLAARIAQHLIAAEQASLIEQAGLVDQASATPRDAAVEPTGAAEAASG